MKTTLKLRVDAIEQERKARGWTQVQFVDAMDISKRRYQTILKETREGSFPNVGTHLIDAICSTLGWSLSQVVEQIIVE